MEWRWSDVVTEMQNNFFKRYYETVKKAIKCFGY